MERLPDHIIKTILLYLPPRDMCACFKSAKLFHILTEAELNKIKYSKMSPYSFIKRDDLYGYQYAINNFNRIDLLSKYLLKAAIKLDKPLIATFLLQSLYNSTPLNGDFQEVYIEYAVKHSAVRCIILWKYTNCCMMNGLINNDTIPIIACSDGDLETIRTILFISGDDKSPKDLFKVEAVNTVIKTEDFSKIRLLYSLGCKHSTNSLAARNGNVCLLSFLMSRGSLQITDTSISAAASHGHTMALKLLFIYGILSEKKYYHIQEYAFGGAASERSLETVRFIHFITKPCMISSNYDNRLVLNYAIKRGDLNIVRWLFLLGYKYYMCSFTIAAQWCDYKFIKYAFDKMGLSRNYKHIYPGHGSIYDRALSFNNVCLTKSLDGQ